MALYRKYFQNVMDYTFGGLGAEYTSWMPEWQRFEDGSPSGFGRELAAPLNFTLIPPIKPAADGAEGPLFAPPVANDDFLFGDNFSPAFNLFADNGSGADFDPDGDTLSIVAINGVGHTAGSTVTLASGLIIDIGMNGQITLSAEIPGLYNDVFTYTVGANGDQADATVTVQFTQLDFDLTNLDGTNGFALNGPTASNGIAGVSNAGDFNDDGIDDFLIGAPGAFGGAGAAYLVFGTNTGFPANFELASLDGTNGVVLRGPEFVEAGFSVAAAGDINGDGIDDIVIGAPGANVADPFGAATLIAAGAAYVVFGTDAPLSSVILLADLDGSDGFAILGDSSNQNLGISVAGAGDFNDDGIDDVIVGGSEFQSGGSGHSYIVYGSTNPAALEIYGANLNGSDGIILEGAAPGDFSGDDVNGGGDFNGDGIQDVIIGAPGRDGAATDIGGAYIVFGTNGAIPPTLNFGNLGVFGVTFNGFASGGAPGGFTGVEVAFAGDFNGDGFDDVIIGGPLQDSGGGTNPDGHVYVVFGSAAPSTDINLNTLNGTNGFIIRGAASDDMIGFEISSIGDFNGDGFDDIIIGSIFADSDAGPDTGASYVIFGTDAGFNPVFDLNEIDGENGFLIEGLVPDDELGTSVYTAGDVNGDGISDLIISANGAEPNGPNTGQAYVLFGSTDYGVQQNQGPEAIDDDVETDEDNAVGGNVIDGIGSGGPDTDPEGDTLEVVGVNFSVSNVGMDVAGDNGGIFRILENGTFSFQPNGEFDYLSPGEDAQTSVTYDLSDGNGNIDTATVTVTVDGVNDAPIAVDDFYTTDQNTQVSDDVVFGGPGEDFDIDDNDDRFVVAVDGDSGNVNQPVNGTGGGTFTIELEGTLTFDPGNDFLYLGFGESAATVVTYTIEDDAGAQSQATVEITVTGLNDAPTLENGPLVETITENNGDSTIFLLDGAQDVDQNDTLDTANFMLVSGNDVGVSSASVNELVLDSDAYDYLADGETETIVYSYDVVDGNGGTVAQTATFNVTGMNDAPDARNDELEINTTSIAANLLADNGNGADGDPDASDSLTVTQINGQAFAAGGSITLASGLVIDDDGTGTGNVEIYHTSLPLGGVITDSFTYTIDDGNGGTDTATVNVAYTQNGIYLGDLNTAGSVIEGGAAFDNLGYSVDGVGDVNGDGVDDFIIGAIGAGPADRGQAFLIYGDDGGLPPVLNAGSLSLVDGITLTGINGNELTGWSVTGLGDVNDDGIDDFAISALEGTLGSNQTGNTYVIFGRDNDFTGDINLGSLDGTDGFIIAGDQDFDQLGSSLSGGDFNNDGINDILIGAVGVDEGLDANVGAAYIVYGSNVPFPGLIETFNLNTATGATILGDGATGQLGTSVANLGDVNGDGIDDIGLGAPLVDSVATNAGAAYVIFGSLGGPAATNVSNLDGTNGFTISGFNVGDAVGFSVAAAGDVNGDGLQDILIGIPGADFNGEPNSGLAAIIYGSAGGFPANVDLANLNGTNGTLIGGVDASDGLGHAVSAAGDVNGDGVDDLLFSSPDFNIFEDNDGAVGVIFGQVGGLGAEFDVETLNGINGFAIIGENENDEAGFSISAAGDVNNDGTADIIIGAPGSDAGGNNSGSAYIVYGVPAIVNAAPEAFDDDFATDQDTDISGDVFADNGNGADTDQDGDPISVSAVDGQSSNVGANVSGDNGGIFNISATGDVSFDPNGDFTYLPDGDSETTAVSYTVADGNGGFDTANVTVTVAGLNDAPVAEDDFLYTNEDDDLNGNVFDDNSITGSLIDFDPDNGDTFTVTEVDGVSTNVGSAIAGDTGGLFTIDSNGDLNFDPNGDYENLGPNDSATSSITYTISDANGETSTATVTVDIAGINDAPQAFQSEYTTDEETFIDGSVHIDTGSGADFDPDSAFDVTQVNGNAANLGMDVAGDNGGTFQISSNGLFEFDPGTDFLGLENGQSATTSVTYTITDDQGETSTSTLSVIVTGISDNQPPLAQDDSLTGALGANTFDLFADNGNGPDSDPEGDNFTITEIDGVIVAPGSSVNLSSGLVISYAGNGDISVSAANPGLYTETFEYTVEDDFGNTDTAEVDITFSVDTLELLDVDGTNGFVLLGDNAGDQAGRSVSAAGDVNGDGVADFIIGARFADDGGADSGTSYVVFGNDSGFPSIIDLGSLNGTDGFAIEGALAGDESGRAVGAAGDVNGDGIDDIIFGAINADPNGEVDAGEAYIVYGTNNGFAASVDLGGLNGSNGLTIAGLTAGDQLGTAVSGIGDINDDGIDDFLISAIGADPSGNSQAGEAYVIFGGTALGADFDLASLNGTNGFVVSGLATGNQAGVSVSGGADVNGDGIADFIIGSNTADSNGREDSGESYVIFGDDSGFDADYDVLALDGTNGYIIGGASAGDRSGESVDLIGDVNGDGIDDILIGAIGADGFTGSSYVMFGTSGSPGGRRDLADLGAGTGFEISGVDAQGLTGFSVSGAGDFNGDGIEDLLIGAIFADANGADSGITYLVYGSASGFPSVLELDTLDGGNGFMITGETAGDNSGGAVSGIGDINDDGYDDLLIGARTGDAGSELDAGVSYVIFGFGPPAVAPPQEPLYPDKEVVAELVDPAGDSSGTENGAEESADNTADAFTLAANAGENNGGGISETLDMLNGAGFGAPGDEFVDTFMSDPFGFYWTRDTGPDIPEPGPDLPPTEDLHMDLYLAVDAFDFF